MLANVFDPKRLLFDPREAMLRIPEWDNLELDWGVGDTGVGDNGVGDNN